MVTATTLGLAHHEEAGPVSRTKTKTPDDLAQETILKERERVQAAREREREASLEFERVIYQIHVDMGWSPARLGQITGLCRTRMVQIIEHQKQLVDETAVDSPEAEVDAARRAKRARDARYRERKRKAVAA